jgi:hypothetical protein
LKTNPGKFFKPAGCITTTVEGLTATHVFDNCTGPYGLATFNGTITSTWTKSPGKLQVVHSATDFKINGSTISGSATVSWSKNGTVYTKTRKASWTGKTGKGKDISRVVDYSATYDAGTKCVTRDGTATTTIGGRGLESSIQGYKRCGIGALGCPEGGKITLTAVKSGASLTIEFQGGRDVVVTRPNGRVVTFKILCREV